MVSLSLFELFDRYFPETDQAVISKDFGEQVSSN